MKRGGPIQRRTPLKQGTALSRGKGMSRPLAAGQPVRVKRPAARRRSAEPAADALAWADVRLVIFARALGLCEGCGCQLNIANMEGHHRRSRSVKGPHRHCPCNAVALCSRCHHDDVHGQPEAARDAGLIVSKLTAAAPGEVPVRIWSRVRPVLLSCGGTYLE